MPYTHPELFKLYDDLCKVKGKKQKPFYCGAATITKTGETEKPNE